MPVFCPKFLLLWLKTLSAMWPQCDPISTPQYISPVFPQMKPPPFHNSPFWFWAPCHSYVQNPEGSLQPESSDEKPQTQLVSFIQDFRTQKL